MATGATGTGTRGPASAANCGGLGIFSLFFYIGFLGLDERIS